MCLTVVLATSAFACGSARVVALPTPSATTTASPAPTPRTLTLLAEPQDLSRDEISFVIGYGTALHLVRFAIDGNEVSPVIEVGDGRYTVRLRDVPEGAHELLVEAPGSAAIVRLFTIDRTAPVLDVAASAFGAELRVVGRSESGARVLVGSTQITPAADGAFAATLPLSGRRQRLTVVARDRAGNETAHTVSATAPIVRGLYVTAYTAASASRRAELFSQAKALGLNAVVVDIKDSSGRVYMEIGSPTADAIGAITPMIEREAFFADAKAAGLYTIARIVSFEDGIFPLAHPEAAWRLPGGALFLGESGLPWTDARSPVTRAYLAEVARAAALAGFDEIQLDYVRFPTGRGQSAIDRGDMETRVAAISSFVDAVDAALEGTGAYLSVDVFGLTTTALDDMSIGQWLPMLAKHVDVISPMVYPSHYWEGSYGFGDPDAEPYGVVYQALLDARERIHGARAILRPWLQDFSLRNAYGPAEVKAQIQAAYDNGVGGFLLWNAANVYTDR